MALQHPNGVFSHKIDYVAIFQEIPNLEGHLNRIIVSRVTAILHHIGCQMCQIALSKSTEQVFLTDPV